MHGDAEHHGAASIPRGAPAAPLGRLICATRGGVCRRCRGVVHDIGGHHAAGQSERVRFVSVIAAAVGLAAIAALIVHFGADAVIGSLHTIGWRGFAAVCLIHLALVAVMGIAWWVLVPATPTWVFLWGRLIRDAGSEVLPLSQMGGSVLGARAVTVAGVPGPVATASTIVDLTLEFFAKLAYTALGLWQALEGGRLLRRLAPRSVTLPVAKAARMCGEDRD